MAYLGESRKDMNSQWLFTLCLTANDCKLLLPIFEKRLKEAEKKHEKYYDIHQGGEATERQEDLLLKYEEEMIALESVVTSAKEMIEHYS